MPSRVEAPSSGSSSSRERPPSGEPRRGGCALLEQVDVHHAGSKSEEVSRQTLKPAGYAYVLRYQMSSPITPQKAPSHRSRYTADGSRRMWAMRTHPITTSWKTT